MDTCTKPPGRRTRVTSRSVLLGIGDVQQAHERGHDIEARCPEREGGPVADDVANTSLVLSGGSLDERLGDIKGDDAGASAGEPAGVVSLAAA